MISFRKSKVHCCKNCHFLTKTVRDNVGDSFLFSWNIDERSKLELKEHYSASCYKGIWDTGIDSRLNSRMKDILLENRRDSCFFIEAQKGMSFQAATELHKIRSENRQLKRSYRYTQIALWLSAIGLILGLILEIFGGMIHNRPG